MTDLQRLGAEVREQLGSPPASFSDRQRLRLRGLDLTAPSRTQKPLLLAALASGAIVVAGLYFWSSQGGNRSGSGAQQVAARAKPPSHEVASADSASAAVWVDATAAPETRRLADGSSISLEVGSRGRLDPGARGTLFDLHEGTASFDVQDQGSKSFSVVAGKYRVVVVGTRFTTAYVPPLELRVVVSEGVVQVHSPDRATPLSVNAGETLELKGIEFSLSKRIPEPAAPGESSGLPAAVSSTSQASWQALYREGKYQNACEVVRAESLGTLQSRLDAATLIDLSSTLRLCGDTAGAMATLGTIRARYPETPQAHDALFLMGRILATAGQARPAISRLDEYLAKGNGGRFAAEALGRLIELHQAVGNQAQARQSAERYLQLAPRGPYRRLAQSVTKEP